MSQRTPIFSLSLTELRERIKEMGEKPYRATQIYEGIHRQGWGDFAELTSLPEALRLYNHAIELAPREDFYYFELGRVYLMNTILGPELAERPSLRVRNTPFAAYIAAHRADMLFNFGHL